MEEFIICSAIHYNDGKIYTSVPKNIDFGFVVCGRRHFDCSEIFNLIATNTADFDKSKISKVRGFLTNSNRFVDRKEAYKIAFNAGQIIGPNKDYPENEIGLTSEDLYFDFE